MDKEEETASLQAELTALRRHFHENPEQSWQETGTQQYIMAYLKKLGIPCVPSTRTGVIATIRGARSSDRILGIRADIDALPVTELGTPGYKSRNKGTMHACGHDAHIAILLGTAGLLAARKDGLKVTVRLIFQPAEEFISDSGAAYMKDDPLVLACDRLIALHIWSRIPAGRASLRYGPVMSAADTFDIFIKGKGGHGALPHQAIDPIVAGSQFVNAVQTIVSRETDPLLPAVISITSFQSGTTSNVIPDEAHLQGMARTFDNALRNAFPGMLERIAQGISAATRADFKVAYHFGPPPLINDDACVRTGRTACEKVFGRDHLIAWQPEMSGEDFAKYKNPKCMLLLGGGFQDEARRYPQHSPYFDIDERALVLGVRYFWEYLKAYEAELD